MFGPAPANHIIRRLGYPGDKEGFLNRYFRESENWMEHLDNCRNFIVECLKDKNIEELVVLGSGWLLDLPLEFLAGSIKRIRLVDISHPPQVLKKIRMYDGVECISADITGGYVERFYNEALHDGKTKSTFNFDGITPPQLILPESGFVISLNVLSQVDSLPVDYLIEHTGIEEETITRIRTKLQSDHIHMLKNQRFILITDYEEIIMNTEGRENERKKLIYTELPVVPHVREWVWMFDDQGTYYKGMKTVLKVRALCSEMPGLQ